jgi:hypothetical protein
MNDSSRNDEAFTIDWFWSTFALLSHNKQGRGEISSGSFSRILIITATTRVFGIPIKGDSTFYVVLYFYVVNIL